MDERTKNYREQQFNQLDIYISEYLPTIQIVLPSGNRTNYINITYDELQKIREILT